MNKAIKHRLIGEANKHRLKGVSFYFYKKNFIYSVRLEFFS
jgi:hypothetical protein